MDPRFKQFLLLFLKNHCGENRRFSFHQLPGDGSHRLFWRLNTTETDQSFVAMANAPVFPERARENTAYLMIARHLHQKGIPLPLIHEHNLSRGWFVMEDLGSRNLQAVAQSGNDPVPVYMRVVELLFRLQTLGGEGFDPSWCSQTEQYDRTVMLTYEAHYFRDAFLKGFLGHAGPLAEIEATFSHLAHKASRASARFFMHRDFQSRNIMVDGEDIRFIDWQGGRLGPLAYDLASLLMDPYARLLDHQKEAIFCAYLEMLKSYDPALIDPFLRDYPYLAIQRNLQILGAFSFLSRVMKKQHFADYIPMALETLEALIKKSGDQGLKPLLELVAGIDLPANT